MRRAPVAALVLLALCLSASLLVVPAQASRSQKGCSKYRPTAPDAASPRASSVPDIPVIKVTDRATEKSPLVVEFQQGAAAWWYAYSEGRGPIVDGNEYWNVQVDTNKRVAGLHVRLEWDTFPIADLDLYLWSYAIVAWSEAVNAAPAEASGDSGGPGYEYIAGYPAADCAGFTIENNAMWTPPQAARLKLWLGPMGWNG